MYLVAIAWLYIAVMMAAAEATHPSGSVLGAIFTFLLYGVLPVSIVVYIMGAPKRRKAIKAREAVVLPSTNPQESTSPEVKGNGTPPQP